MTLTHFKSHLWSKIANLIVVTTFSLSLLLPSPAQAQSLNILPPVGTLVRVTPGFTPPTLKGLTINPENPFRINFIIDHGELNLTQRELEEESNKLVKYFLAALTLPEDELWVNLSPFEQSRITTPNLGITEMGRDMLAQDYLLKQLVASITNPDSELGATYWERVYAKTAEVFGQTEIGANTFNKIWITAGDAEVYEHGSTAFVLKGELNVLLEEDYRAMGQHIDDSVVASDFEDKDDVSKMNYISSVIAKKLLVPRIEKEVNEGRNFTKLRQIYNALILATWYKKTLKQQLLNLNYSDQNKVAGVAVSDEEIAEKIYEQYVESFKTGVYELVKEGYDPISQEIIPRKYFSGGVNIGEDKFGAKLQDRLVIRRDQAQLGDQFFATGTNVSEVEVKLSTSLDANSRNIATVQDYAMVAEVTNEINEFIPRAETAFRGLAWTENPNALDVQLTNLARERNLDYLRVSIQSEEELNRLLSTTSVVDGEVYRTQGPLAKLIEEGGLLMIDYTASNPKFVEALNSLFDPDPYFKDYSVSPKLKLVGAISSSQSEDYPVSFYSRFRSGQISPSLTLNDPISQIESYESDQPFEGIQIDLKEMLDPTMLREALVGGYFINDQGDIQVLAGALVQAMQSNQPLLIEGANWNNDNLADLLRKIIIRGTLEFNGELYSLPNEFKIFRRDVDYTTRAGQQTLKLAGEISPSEQTNTWVINKANQDVLFDYVRINSDGRISRNQGIKAQSFEGAVSLLITDQLDEFIWNSIMTDAKFASIEVAPHVVVPQRYQGLRSDQLKKATPKNVVNEWDNIKSQKGILLEGEDLDFINTVITSEFANRTIHRYPITPETSLQELVSRMEVVSAENGNRRFASRLQDVIQFLRQGDTVVLEGLQANDALMKELETVLQEQPYLIDNGERVELKDLPGQIILTSKANPRLVVHTSKRARLNPTDQQIGEILAKEFPNRFSSENYQNVLQMRDVFNTIQFDRPELYPMATSFSLSRMRLLYRFNNWLEGFENVMIGNYADNPQIASFLRVAARMIFSEDYIGQSNNSIHARKLQQVLNKVVSIGDWRDHAWELADALSLDLLQQAQLGLNYSDVRTDQLYRMIQNALVKLYSNEVGQEERAEFYRFKFGIDQDVGSAPDLNASLRLPYETWQERLERVVKALTISPAVMLKGSPGTGKSYITETLARELGYSTREVIGPVTTGSDTKESDIVLTQEFLNNKTQYFNQAVADWANLENGGLLIIDEANLTPSEFWNFLGGLFDANPYVWINGRRMELTERHRVIFTGNQESLEGRRLQNIVTANMIEVPFPTFTRDFIRDRVGEYVSSNRANRTELIDAIVDLHFFFQQMNPVLEFSLRDVQELSVRANVLLDAQWDMEDLVFSAWNIYRGNFTPEESLAFEYLMLEKYGVLINDLRAGRNQSVQQQIAESEVQSTVTYTDSAAEMAGSLFDFLDVRRVRMAGDSLVQGKRGMVFEGPSGRGKDVLVLDVLKQDGFGEAGTILGIFDILQNAGVLKTEQLERLHQVLIDAGLLRLQSTPVIGFNNDLSAKFSAYIQQGWLDKADTTKVFEALLSSGILGERGTVEELIRSRSYYRLTASLDTNQIVNTVRQAQKDGSVVIISEMNLLPSGFLEGTLNDVLTGNAHQGFALIATMNSVDFSGRERLSSALQNRLIYEIITDYSEAELIQIGQAFVNDNFPDYQGLSQEELTYIVKSHMWVRDQISMAKHHPTTRNLLNAIGRAVHPLEDKLPDNVGLPGDQQGKPAVFFSGSQNYRDAVLTEYHSLFLDKFLKGVELPSEEVLLNYTERSRVDNKKMIEHIANYLIPNSFGLVELRLDPSDPNQSGGYWVSKYGNAESQSYVALRTRSFSSGNWFDVLMHETSHGRFTRNSVLPVYKITAAETDGQRPISLMQGSESISTNEYSDSLDPVWQDLEDVRHEATHRFYFPNSDLSKNSVSENRFANIVRNLDVNDLLEWMNQTQDPIDLRQMFQYALVVYGKRMVSRANVEAFADVIDGLLEVNPFELSRGHLQTAREIAEAIPRNQDEEEIQFQQFRALKRLETIRATYIAIPDSYQDAADLSQQIEQQELEVGLDALDSISTPSATRVSEDLNRQAQANQPTPEEIAAKKAALLEKKRQIEAMNRQTVLEELDVMEEDLSRLPATVHSHERINEILSVLTDTQYAFTLVRKIQQLDDAAINQRVDAVLSNIRNRQEWYAEQRARFTDMSLEELRAEIELIQQDLDSRRLLSTRLFEMQQQLTEQLDLFSLAPHIERYNDPEINAVVELLKSTIESRLQRAIEENIKVEEEDLEDYVTSRYGLGLMPGVGAAEGNLTGLNMTIPGMGNVQRRHVVHTREKSDRIKPVAVAEKPVVRAKVPLRVRESTIRNAEMQTISNNVQSELLKSINQFFEVRYNPDRVYGQKGVLDLERFMTGDPTTAYISSGGIPQAQSKELVLSQRADQNQWNMLNQELFLYLFESGFRITVYTTDRNYVEGISTLADLQRILATVQSDVSEDAVREDLLTRKRASEFEMTSVVQIQQLTELAYAHGAFQIALSGDLNVADESDQLTQQPSTRLTELSPETVKAEINQILNTLGVSTTYKLSQEPSLLSRADVYAQSFELKLNDVDIPTEQLSEIALLLTRLSPEIDVFVKVKGDFDLKLASQIRGLASLYFAPENMEENELFAFMGNHPNRNGLQVNIDRLNGVFGRRSFSTQNIPAKYVAQSNGLSANDLTDTVRKYLSEIDSTIGARIVTVDTGYLMQLNVRGEGVNISDLDKLNAFLIAQNIVISSVTVDTDKNLMDLLSIPNLEKVITQSDSLPIEEIWDLLIAHENGPNIQVYMATNALTGWVTWEGMPSDQKSRRLNAVVADQQQRIEQVMRDIGISDYRFAIEDVSENEKEITVILGSPFNASQFQQMSKIMGEQSLVTGVVIPGEVSLTEIANALAINMPKLKSLTRLNVANSSGIFTNAVVIYQIHPNRENLQIMNRRREGDMVFDYELQNNTLLVTDSEGNRITTEENYLAIEQLPAAAFQPQIDEIRNALEQVNLSEDTLIELNNGRVQIIFESAVNYSAMSTFSKVMRDRSNIEIIDFSLSPFADYFIGGVIQFEQVPVVVGADMNLIQIAAIFRYHPAADQITVINKRDGQQTAYTFDEDRMTISSNQNGQVDTIDMNKIGDLITNSRSSPYMGYKPVDLPGNHPIAQILGTSEFSSDVKVYASAEQAKLLVDFSRIPGFLAGSAAQNRDMIELLADPFMPNREVSIMFFQPDNLTLDQLERQVLDVVNSKQVDVAEFSEREIIAGITVSPLTGLVNLSLEYVELTSAQESGSQEVDSQAARQMEDLKFKVVGYLVGLGYSPDDSYVGIGDKDGVLEVALQNSTSTTFRPQDLKGLLALFAEKDYGLAELDLKFLESRSFLPQFYGLVLDDIVGNPDYLSHTWSEDVSNNGKVVNLSISYNNSPDYRVLYTSSNPFLESTALLLDSSELAPNTRFRELNRSVTFRESLDERELVIDVTRHPNIFQEDLARGESFESGNLGAFVSLVKTHRKYKQLRFLISKEHARVSYQIQENFKQRMDGGAAVILQPAQDPANTQSGDFELVLDFENPQRQDSNYLDQSQELQSGSLDFLRSIVNSLIEPEQTLLEMRKRFILDGQEQEFDRLLKEINVSDSAMLATDDQLDDLRDTVNNVNTKVNTSAIEETPIQNPGGIDFNPSNINLRIRTDGKPSAIPNAVPISEPANFDGLYPVIINITPITNLQLLLGLADDPAPDSYDLSRR